MLTEIIREAWIALRRNYTRSLLTMLGIVWGIATVTLLIAYGSSFRQILVNGFDAFGKGAVVCWPQQTSEQPGGQRAGKKVVLEQADLEMVKETARRGLARTPPCRIYWGPHTREIIQWASGGRRNGADQRRALHCARNHGSQDSVEQLLFQ